MLKLQLDKSKCSVVGCMNRHKSLHRLPASEPLRSAWLNFIFIGNVPTPVGKVIFVCAKHFQDECFNNLQQYQEGFAERLRLIEGSVPSVYGNDELSKTRCTPTRQGSFTKTDCQTKPQVCSLGIQHPIKTLQPHVKSIGTLVTPECLDVGINPSATLCVQTHAVLSFTPVKQQLLSDIKEEMTPIKRSRVEQTNVGNDTLEGSSSVNTQNPQDPSYDPEDSISDLSEVPEHKEDQQSSEVPSCQSAQQHQTQLDSIFLLLEDKMVTFVKKELKKIQKLLSSNHSQSLESQMAEEDDLDGEEEEKRSNIEAFLKITLDFLRKMNQEELAERLQSMVPTDVHVPIKGEAPEEQRSDEDQQDQKHLHIKEEEEELWTSLGEEQLNVKEETDATSFLCTAVHLKHEDNKDKTLFLQLHQHQVEFRDHPTSSSTGNLESVTGGESCGEAETTRNPDLSTHEDDSNSSETEVSEADIEDDVNNPDLQLKDLADSGSETEDTDKDWGSSPNRVHESGVKNKTNENKPFCCDFCGQRFTTPVSLNTHRRIHTEQKPFCCELCDQRVTTKSHLNRHLRIHERQKPFSCELCDRRFSQKVNLNTHMRIHTGQKPYSCELCDRRFSQKANLNTHTKIHTGQKPYCCELCGRSFTHKGDLNRHMRIHTGQKPFCCELCDRRFTTKGDLNTHMRIHTGQKPFCCEMCDGRFTTKCGLKTHTRIHTENKAVISNVS